MIDDTYHVRLDGIPYRIASASVGEDGNSYVATRNPIRALSTQLVQGESAAEFNLRPDIMEWRSSDWSGVPLRRKFSTTQPANYRLSTGFDLSQPGIATSGYPSTAYVPEMGAQVSDPSPAFPTDTNVVGYARTNSYRWYGVKGDGTAFENSYPAYILDTELTPESIPFCVDYRGVVYMELYGNPNGRSVAYVPIGDRFREYTYVRTTTEGSSTSNSTEVFSQVRPFMDVSGILVGQDGANTEPGAVITQRGVFNIASISGYIYLLWKSSGLRGGLGGSAVVFEKEIGTTENPGERSLRINKIFDERPVWEVPAGNDETIANPTPKHMTASENRVYFLVNTVLGCRIYEVRPATPGLADRTNAFGAEYAFLHGLRGESIHYHRGQLFVLANDTNRFELQLLAIGSDRAVRTVGKLTDYWVNGKSWNVGRFVDAADHQSVWMFVGIENYGRRVWELWQYNLDTGALFSLETVDGVGRNHRINSAAMDDRGTIYGTFYTWAGTEPTFIGLAGELPHTPLQLTTAYRALDWHTSVRGATQFKEARIPTVTTTASNAANAFLETGDHDFNTSSEKVALAMELEVVKSGSSNTPDTFRGKMEVWLDEVPVRWDGNHFYSFNGPPFYVPIPDGPTFRSARMKVTSTTPGWSVEGFSLYATVVRGIKEWQLTLDVSDEIGGDARRGEDMINHLRVLQESHSVVSLEDGYHSADPGVFGRFDVVVDNVYEVLSQPGEGLVQVNLREVKEL